MLLVDKTDTFGDDLSKNIFKAFHSGFPSYFLFLFRFICLVIRMIGLNLSLVIWTKLLKWKSSATDPLLFGAFSYGVLYVNNKFLNAFMNDLDFCFNQDIISQFDKFIDPFILFSQNSFLRINISLFVIFLIMIAYIIYLDIVFLFKFL